MTNFPNLAQQTKEDLDLYRLQAEKLSRTVKVLQEDLSSSSSRRRATKDGAAVREGLSEQQEDSIEQILEEFQKKSEQAGGFDCLLSNFSTLH